LLADLIGTAPTVAVAGLAKNVGKTTTLGVLIRELSHEGHTVGVSSLGRDGEQFDVLDSRIPKPAINLPAHSLVATTVTLLRDGEVPYTVVSETNQATPLGRVVVVRTLAAGRVEVAGPASVSGMRATCATMRAHGADHVLIDGSIDRRAGTSPALADAVVLATGAAVHRDMAAVAERTSAAVDLIRLPLLTDTPVRRVAMTCQGSTLVTPDLRLIPVQPRLTLEGQASVIGRLAQAQGPARWLVIRGALCESLVENMMRQSSLGETTLVVQDASKVFLSRHTASWYRRRGVRIEAVLPTSLRAITVNPVAPGSHSFDSSRLCEYLAEMIAGVPIFDVQHSTVGSPNDPRS
jgi:hypothetical protein